jgi:hypothetical protein
MSELRKWMIRDMKSRNFSPGTQRAYLRVVAGLAKYYHRSPDTIKPEEIQDYIVHLLSERKLAMGVYCPNGPASHFAFKNKKPLRESHRFLPEINFTYFSCCENWNKSGYTNVCCFYKSIFPVFPALTGRRFTLILFPFFLMVCNRISTVSDERPPFNNVVPSNNFHAMFF